MSGRTAFPSASNSSSSVPSATAITPLAGRPPFIPRAPCARPAFRPRCPYFASHIPSSIPLVSPTLQQLPPHTSIPSNSIPILDSPRMSCHQECQDGGAGAVAGQQVRWREGGTAAIEKVDFETGLWSRETPLACPQKLAASRRRLREAADLAQVRWLTRARSIYTSLQDGLL